MDCLKCKSALHSIMARPRPKALLEALEKTGIKTLENAPESKRANERPEQAATLNIKCLDCSEEGIAMKARAYMEAPPMSVVLCANRLADRTEMEEALVHELVHVYDHALVKMDLTSCDQLAYSEVRAAREAECHYSPQLCSWFKRQCAKNTATRSTSTLFPNDGAACVARVFEQAYHDTAPMALQGGSAEATGPIKGPPVPDSKIPPPIGRIPAAASLNRSEGPLRGGLGVGVGAWQGHAQAQAQGQGQEAQQQQGVGASSNMGLHGGVQMMPPPATGLVELLIDDWGRQPPSWSSSRK